ncbi:hypothetical protein PsYK624_064280 [Phanerochaete sordida]|uniref:Uncharacterized protein n=1 Tax=Phanerochaete sordida TaxID=48140 RepID=A0A9P3G9I3_9APHY|nr:hypothetical protein PsYK624_064280 [Phanerochaete sordida]
MANVLNAAAGPPAAQGQALFPSWLVKLGWVVYVRLRTIRCMSILIPLHCVVSINIDKKQFVNFSMPVGKPTTLTVSMPNGQQVQHLLPPAVDDLQPSADRIASAAGRHDEVIWPLSEPAVLPLDDVLRLIEQNTPTPAAAYSMHNRPPRGMHNLPSDVLLHIFDAIDNVGDATRLCLTHPELLCAGYKRVEELGKKRWAPWAGDRVLALPGKQDRTFWLDARTHTPGVLATDSDLRADITAAGGLAPYLETYARAAPFGRCPDTLRALAHKMPRFDWATSPALSVCCHPSDAAWLVCNLTRREYVRVAPARTRDGQRSADALMQADATGDSVAADLPLRVGKSVANRIYASSGSAGAWAGHRVMIRRLEVAKVSFKDWAQWKDVTKDDDPANDPWYLGDN